VAVAVTAAGDGSWLAAAHCAAWRRQLAVAGVAVVAVVAVAVAGVAVAVVWVAVAVVAVAVAV
jgi:hypothetical protein